MACDTYLDIMDGECYYAGSTLEAINLTITNTIDGVDIPVDLTDAEVKMQWKKQNGGKSYLDWTLDNYISVSSNVATIAKHTPTLEAGEYFSDLYIKFANDDVWTGVGKFSLTVNKSISQ